LQSLLLSIETLVSADALKQNSCSRKSFEIRESEERAAIDKARLAGVQEGCSASRSNTNSNGQTQNNTHNRNFQSKLSLSPTLSIKTLEFIDAFNRNSCSHPRFQSNLSQSVSLSIDNIAVIDTTNPTYCCVRRCFQSKLGDTSYTEELQPTAMHLYRKVRKVRVNSRGLSLR